MPIMTSLDSFTRAYIETALWSSNDESDESGGEPNFDLYIGDDGKIHGSPL